MSKYEKESCITLYNPWYLGFAQELGIDPCIDTFTENYLNHPEVKKAFHADRNITWISCR
jgi:hypothetical protein